MAILRAFRPLDMNHVLPKAANVTATDRIVIEGGDLTTTLTGDIEAGSFGVRGSVTGYSQTLGGALVFSASGIQGSARTIFSILATGDNDRFLAYTLASDDRLVGSSGSDHLAGMNGADTLLGGTGADSLFGGSSTDTLKGGWGADFLAGGLASDVLDGGAGSDRLLGGAGADTFVFRSAAEANGDRILDLGPTDRVNLAAIDADLTHAGNQAFHYLGTSGFSGHAGELALRGGWLVADLDGNGSADFRVHVGDLHAHNLIL